MLKWFFNRDQNLGEIADNIAILNYIDRTGTKTSGTNDLRKLIDRQVLAYLNTLEGES